MGKDRAERVSSAPRGLGLYRRRGREGFFFVKNLAAQAKKHPGQIERAYIDEQIRRLTEASSPASERLRPTAIDAMQKSTKCCWRCQARRFRGNKERALAVPVPNR